MNASRAKYINGPHKTIEEIVIMSCQRVRHGESKWDVLKDVTEGHDLGYGSVNYHIIKEKIEEEEKKMYSGNNTTHTQGPWEQEAWTVFEHGEIREYAGVIHNMEDGSKRYICDCWGLKEEKRNGKFEASDEAIANARFIAAAPDMLRALEDAEKILAIAHRYFPKSIKNHDTFALCNYEANSVKKAIAKAKGE